MANPKPIGIFDSGVGGLSVVRSIRKVLPNENIIYVGDLKHFPYGTKTEEEVKTFAKNITKFLISQGVKLIIVACNTVSSIAMDDLRVLAKPIEVIGMIQSGAEYAVKTTKIKKVGVISTPLTARKHAYKNEIKKLDSSIEVFEVGSQELVNLVEDGVSFNDYACALAREKLEEPLSNGIDTLVLGCTHFPFLYKVVKNVVGEKVEVIDPAEYIAIRTVEYLKEIGENKDSQKTVFYTTYDKDSFKEKLSLFLDIENPEVYEVDI
ncbi:glutamate racemase [Caldisericum exile]|uniref:Glutamate racemase n=1 Tax=Caldisericum exile (strain DSM 21853 / NBRC 104410 / AZM16c01) TaxID=511051 RepID=A0A7U6GFD8_CALEA|nr:glutamate racemase [Caldisericum exile]BAL81344.1 glutamate racemase [Caldisericum exile AZM16c01]